MFTQKKLTFALLILTLWLALAPAALAQDGTPEPPPDDPVIVVEEAPAESPAPTEQVGMTLASVLALMVFLLTFFPMVGGSVGALNSTIVDILKAVGIVKDGWAALPVLVLNFAAIVVLYVIYGIKPGEAIPADLDATLKSLTDLIAYAFTFIGSISGGKLFHDRVLKHLSARFSHSPKATWTASSASAAEAPGHRPV